jgi:hypothetical protein
MLNIPLGQLDSGRTTIDHATDGRAMGFAKRGDAKNFTKGVSGHILLANSRTQV